MSLSKQTMKKFSVFPLIAALAFFVSCQKQQTEEERKAEVERQVQDRLAAERLDAEKQRLAQEQANLQAREKAVSDRETAANAVVAEPTAITATTPVVRQRTETRTEKRSTASYGMFYQKLDSYGEWRETNDYGYVWQPREAEQSRDWRPYTEGRWVYSDAGWTWVSDEPFGWAVYHYGRWAFSPAMGWMWLPGSVWAPAWVSWRWTDGYAAWCPLGPRYVVYQPALWVVVPSRQFLEPVRHYAVPLRQRPSLPLPVRTAPRAGPPLAAVERATGRSVRPVVFQPQPHVSHAQPATQRTQGVPRATPRPTWPAASPTPAPLGGPRATPRPTWYGAAPAQPRQQPAPRSAPAPHAVAPRASTP